MKNDIIRTTKNRTINISNSTINEALELASHYKSRKIEIIDLNIKWKQEILVRKTIENLENVVNNGFVTLPKFELITKLFNILHSNY